MRYSKFLLPTLKEMPSDTESTAQSYMIRAGLIRKVSSGLFNYLPYFNMILRKVSYELRRSMEKMNANEMKFPILVSKEVLDASGRWNAFGKEMFSLHDRNNNEYAISPTNEESATLVAKSFVRSYNDLPFAVYQIQQKHRDEIRPRNGVIRAREFTMKDAYSFHEDTASLNSYYNDMKNEYFAFFDRLGLKTCAVDADGGAMGGSYCEEFQALASEGETPIAFCDECGYAANLETVPCIDRFDIKSSFKGRFKKVETPNAHTITELMNLLQMDSSLFVKSMVYNCDGKIVMALVRGDRAVNEIKLAHLTHASVIELADEKDVRKINSIIGFIGPVGMSDEVTIFADNEIKSMSNFVVGANEKDMHLIDVNPLDFKCTWADIRNANENDVCPKCGKPLTISMGTELGHIFALGKKYTNAFDVQFVGRDGKNKVMEMGCYGIGLERVVSAIIDQHHDEKGLVLPMNIAPFKIDIIIVDNKKDEQVKTAEKLYNELENKGIAVLLDDRDVRAGVKFNDFELIGVPIKVVCGRGIEDGNIEITMRDNDEKFIVQISDAIKFLRELINNG